MGRSGLRGTSAVACLALVSLATLASTGALHGGGCTPTQAGEDTVLTIDLTLAGGPLLYLEERGAPQPLPGSPPIPGSGFLLGEGTWLYRERNGLDGLQRGGIWFSSGCFPPPPLPCVLLTEDPLYDENCGHGPDELVI